MAHSAATDVHDSRKNRGRGWRGEDGTGDGRGQHSRSDPAGVRRLVPGTAARNYCNLAAIDVRPDDHIMSLELPHGRVGERRAMQHLRDNVVGIIY